MRTSRKTVTFAQPFSLRGIGAEQPAGTYVVETDEELLEGLPFPAYRRVATMILLPARAGDAVSGQLVAIGPSDLDTAEKRDAGQLGPAKVARFRALACSKGGWTLNVLTVPAFSHAAVGQCWRAGSRGRPPLWSLVDLRLSSAQEMLPPKQQGKAAFGQTQAGPGSGSLLTIHRQALDRRAMAGYVGLGTCRQPCERGKSEASVSGRQTGREMGNGRTPSWTGAGGEIAPPGLKCFRRCSG